MNASQHAPPPESRARSTRGLVLAATIAVLLATGAAWLAVGGDSGSADHAVGWLPSAALKSAVPNTELAREPVALTEPLGDLDPSTPVPDDSQREPASAEIAPEERVFVAARRLAVPAGTLVVHAVDRSQLGPLRWFDVRVASATRFATHRSDGLHRELELLLTPGSYAAVVMSPGYEPAEIPSITVENGQTARIPTISLEPGSGRLHVEVLGDPRSERELSVELMGEGRHPCEHCVESGDVETHDRFAFGRAITPADQAVIARAQARLDSMWNHALPCRACGFARDKSSFPLRGGGTCTFTNLASGEYALRLADDSGQTTGEEQRVTLVARATASIEFGAYDTRSVEIEIFDVDGSSLAAEWSRRVKVAESTNEFREIVEFFGSAEALLLMFTADGREVAHTTFVPPAIEGHAVGTAIGISRRRMAPATSSIPQVVDRPRSEADALRPEAKAPHFPPLALKCDLLDDGRLTLGPLPAARLDVRVSRVGASGVASIPASRDTTRVRVRLRAP